jgi:hypothetical protein
VTLNEYQKLATNTDITPKMFMQNSEGEMIEIPFMYPALGLGEAGEVQNKIKKIFRDGNGVITDATRLAIKGELGGLLWYTARLAAICGIEFDDVALYNIAQLADRQARGVLQGSGDNR